METIQRYNRTKKLREEILAARDPDQIRHLCKDLRTHGAEQAEEWFKESIETSLMLKDHSRAHILLEYYHPCTIADYISLMRVCPDETLMWMIQTIAPLAEMTATDLKIPFEDSLNRDKLNITKWIYDYIVERYGKESAPEIKKVYSNNLAQNTEEVLSMLKWIKSVNGSLSISILGCAAHTGSREIVSQVEEQIGVIESFSEPDRCRTAWSAVSGNGGDEFIDWMLSRTKITMDHLLADNTLPWPKYFIVGKLRGKHLAAVVSHVAKESADEQARFVGETFLLGNLEAAEVLHKLLNYTADYIAANTRGFEEMHKFPDMVRWTINTLGFHVKILETLTLVYLHHGVENAEELLRELLAIEPKAVALLQPQLTQVLSTVCQSQWKSQRKKEIFIWLVDLFRMENLEEDIVIMMAETADTLPPELMSWILEKFKPVWKHHLADRLYYNTLKKNITFDQGRNVETLELLHSAGIVPINPQQVLTSSLRSIVGDPDAFALEWMLERFHLKIELTADLISDTRYYSLQQFKWLMRNASITTAENRFLTRVSSLAKARLLADRYSALMENGKEIYLPFTEACDSGDIEAAYAAAERLTN